MDRFTVHEVYDDRVATLLHWGASAASAARLAALCNLIDLLIQDRKATHGEVRTLIFETLNIARHDLTEGALGTLAQGLRHAPKVQMDLLDWFLSHTSTVRALVLQNVNLSAENWFRLLPRLSRDERALVYARPDLGFEIKQFTASFGTPHLLLSGPLDAEPRLSSVIGEPPDMVTPAAHAPPHPEPGSTTTNPQEQQLQEQQFLAQQSQEQVRNLLERIAAFQKKTTPANSPEAPASSTASSDTAALAVYGDALDFEPAHAKAALHARTPAARMGFDEAFLTAAATHSEQAHPAYVSLPAHAAPIKPSGDVHSGQDGAPGGLQKSPEPKSLQQQPMHAPAQMVRAPAALTELLSLTCDILWESDRYAILHSVVCTSNQTQSDAVYEWRHRSLLELCAKPRPPAALVRALERRVPFRDLPVLITTQGVAARWLISGIPIFAKNNGAYQGFRGTASLCAPEDEHPKPDYFSTNHEDFSPLKPAPPLPANTQRRPVLKAVQSSIDPKPAHHEQVDAQPHAQSSAPHSSVNAIAALAHEFRTPLNAIMGFAQMIGEQTRGPVAPIYRERAEAILDQSHHVLQAIDDVTDVGKLERKIYPLQPGLIDPTLLIEQVLAAHKMLAQRNGIILTSRIMHALPGIWADLEGTRKALSRLLGAALGAAQSGEGITVGAHVAPRDHLCLCITRPLQLRSPEFAKFFSVHTPQSKPLAAIGIGFALRLAEHLAQAMGGKVVVSEASFELRLPCLPHMLSPLATPAIPADTIAKAMNF